MRNTIDRFVGQYTFLSNFFIAPVKYEDATYASVEHAFQAAKTFDAWQRQRIALSETPGLAKLRGRRVPLRHDWEEVKDGVMLTLLRDKFSGSLGNQLLATGDAKLVEGNTWGDTYWGVCSGEGMNMLGLLLMQVRHELESLQL